MAWLGGADAMEGGRGVPCGYLLFCRQRSCELLLAAHRSLKLHRQLVSLTACAFGPLRYRLAAGTTQASIAVREQAARGGDLIISRMQRAAALQRLQGSTPVARRPRSEQGAPVKACAELAPAIQRTDSCEERPWGSPPAGH